MIMQEELSCFDKAQKIENPLFPAGQSYSARAAP